MGTVFPLFNFLKVLVKKKNVTKMQEVVEGNKTGKFRHFQGDRCLEVLLADPLVLLGHRSDFKDWRVVIAEH